MNKSITTHTLRHTPISTISQMGIPLKAIMDHVGHIDHKTTLHVYSHETKNMEQDLFEKLNLISLTS
ncbi:tyrosine-type recombinase/integrase [Macrococcoides caseolyticum]|uniref:tyrosine-type recombinase/integrase n=1 Tax=Macrococcoides caseolyticum TaxID=69966 RepID=UPI0039C93B7E